MMSQSICPTETLMQIVHEKHKLIPNLMKKFNIHCWMVVIRETQINSDSVQPLVIGSDVVLTSAFIFSLTKEIFTKKAVVGNFEANEFRNQGIWDEVIVYEKGISDILQDTIAKINPNNIALNYSKNDVSADGLSHGLFLKLADLLGDYKDRFISAEPLITAIRGIKTPTEVSLIRKACEITRDINETVIQSVNLGMSETYIQSLFFEEMEKRGVVEAWMRSQCPMIDVGPDKEFGHIGPQATNILKSGHTLHNDLGVKYRGYCSDFQRMWFIGEEKNIPEELNHAFQTIVNAIDLAKKAIKPGVSGLEIDAIARNYIVSRGYGEYKHALGHQVGIYDHDGGTLLGPKWERYGKSVEGLLEENQIFTIEPSLKTKHYGMVSLEEMIVVTSDGNEWLLPPQTNWKFIPAEEC